MNPSLPIERLLSFLGYFGDRSNGSQRCGNSVNNTPTKSAAPAQSEIESLLQGAYFHDAWAIPAAEPNLTALGQFLRVATMTPLWIEWESSL